jgi:hypothetical protein
VSKGEVPDDVLRATTPRYAGRAEPERDQVDVPVG